jgi:hypothetical protein
VIIQIPTLFQSTSLVETRQGCNPLYLFGSLTLTRIPFRLSTLAIVFLARLSHSELLDILEHQPTLGMLQLFFSIEFHSRPSRTVHLPSLRTLWLSDHPNVCVLILDHLTTPPVSLE